MNLSIYPSVGVARLGNSDGQFYLAPDQIGGLPYEADQFGNKGGVVQKFKDTSGQVRKQGQRFSIYDDEGNEITLDSPNIESLEWNVHIANKKAAWYQYSELQGNLLYGESNSYCARGTEFRNAKETGEEARRELIVDPGPRTVSGPRESVQFDAADVPAGYPAQFPPSTVTYGTPITTLGELLTDDSGRLIVLGGKGNAGGDQPLDSYGGSDTWHDDISDGPVYCTVRFKDGTPAQTLQAWVIVGSPDFAPEIVNISNLSDTMFDVAVRSFNLVPDLCQDGQYNPDFVASYERDIAPIIERLGRYQWVANVQAMSAFSSNIFDFKDNSEENRANREKYFSYFRQPNDKSNPSSDQPQQVLFSEQDGGSFPMMPLNSGSNSVSNADDNIVVKFLALDETQYFLLGQWAKGLFSDNPVYEAYPVNPMNQASVGNCVGLPMCPGIEVTWSVQNSNIYSDAYVIKDEKGIGGYDQTGLTPSRDECEGGGCEPGDLTKRMACPWQADFFQCTVQFVNFTDPAVNKTKDSAGDSIPLPPTYYAYWWPPQSPWDVLAGETTVEGQAASHLPAGEQINYARGINSFVQMVENWYALAFIRDGNSANDGYPYFTETERTNNLFSFEEVPVGKITGNTDDNETTIPVFYIESDKEKLKKRGVAAVAMLEKIESRAFKPIAVAEGGLGMPRSGRRARR